MTLPMMQPSRSGGSTETPPARPFVDYRDRISVATWLILLGLGISLLLDFAPIIFAFRALGSPASVMINASTLTAAFLAVLAASGAEGVMQSHPTYAALGGLSRLRRTWVFWALPMAIVVIAALLLPLAPTRLMQVLSLLLAAGLFAFILSHLYATVEEGRPGFRRSRILLNVLAYGCALMLFLLVYQTRTRSLLSGSLVAATATLVAVELLRHNTGQVRPVFLYAAITGMLLGQITWALNYWLLPGLIGGLLLMLVFYLVVGIAQQAIRGGLNRRVLLEFALFTLLALILIAVVGADS